MPDGYAGFPIYESWLVPRDQVIGASDLGAHVIHVHPSTRMRMTGNDLYTRHTVGSLEAERDRRWAAKARPGARRHPRVP